VVVVVVLLSMRVVLRVLLSSSMDLLLLLEDCEIFVVAVFVDGDGGMCDMTAIFE
jgi:hypothetical protein